MALELIPVKKKPDLAIHPLKTRFQTSHQGVAVTVRIGRVRVDNTRLATITARSRVDLPCRLDLKPRRAPRWWFFTDDHAAALGLGDGYRAEGAPLAVLAKLLDEQIRRELDELPVERLRVGRRQVRLQVSHPIYEPDAYPREFDLVTRIVLRASDAVALADHVDIEPSYRGTAAPSVIAAIQVQRRAELQHYARQERGLFLVVAGVVVGVVAAIAAACC
jgi:hypothetical protein